MLTINKKRKTKPDRAPDTKPDNLLDTTVLANACYETLVEAGVTSLVMAFEMSPEGGLRDMTIVTGIAIVPTEYAEDYADRAGVIHHELIEQFKAERRLKLIEEELKEDRWQV